MTTMSRRRLLVLSGTAVLAAGAAACSREAGPGGSAVKISWSLNASRDKLINAAVDAAQQKMGITIDRESGTGAQFADKVNAQLASGGGPDIWLTQILALSQYTSTNAAYKLGEFVPDPIDMSSWDQQAVLGGQVNQEQYAISSGSNTFLMLYESAPLNRAGIGSLDPGYTWDDLASISNEVAKANPGMAGVADGSADLQVFQVYQRSYGGDIFSVDGKFLPTVSDMVEFWNYWAALRKSGGTTTPEVTAKFASSGDIAQTALVLKEAAIDWSFTNRLPAMESLVGHPLSYSTYPEADRPGMFIRPSLLWIVGARSPQAEQAAQLIDHLVNDIEVVRLLEANLGLPDNPEIFATLKAEAEDTRMYDFLELAREGHTTQLANPVFPPGGSDMQDAFETQAQAVAFGQTSPADAAQAVIDAYSRAVQ